ncbi:MAG: NADH dehydrogenase FAD-containing subunit [Acidobacteria bacterium]|nr:MAG: NADH dehydrogenase FAD-containing subunit [Acidobacteriota bacterium]
MILALILLPTICAAAVFVLGGTRLRRVLLVGAAIGHAGMTALAWWRVPQPALAGWLSLDAPGLLFLTVTSALFLAAALYALGYLAFEPLGNVTDLEEGFLFKNAPEAVFISCMLIFLASMTLVTASRHFGLLWIGIEATTLASAPLIYFHRHHRSLEATWKYLLICSVGIALALLGNFFLGAAVAPSSGRASLLLDDLLKNPGALNPAWLKAAFVLMLIGYGTKMGLAPLHTWLPDAHSEAPSVVSALLSGALLNCAFLGILRIYQLCGAAGQGAMCQKALLTLGVVSVAVGAVFILGQSDFKRLLAYSSVENMGLLAIGLGVGGVGTIGALFHAVNHSLVKGMLFLLAGNILVVYRTKAIAPVRGLLRRLPWTGALWLAGFLAITGTPPFSPFFSKFLILKACFDSGHWLVGVLLLFLLAVIFIGMAKACLSMSQGIPEPDNVPAPVRGWLTVLPPAALAGIALWLGLGIPVQLVGLLDAAARALGGLR